MLRHANTSQSIPTVAQVAKETESGFPFGAVHSQHEQQDEDAKRALEHAVREYEEKRDRLSAAIDSTSTLLNDFTAYNNNEWELTYPQSSLSTSSPHAPRTSSQLRRAQSVAVDEPTSLPSTPIANRSRMQRSSTLANVSAQYSAPNSPSPASSISHTTLTETTSPAGFQVLKLDLALGSNRSSSSSRSLVMSLEKSSVATLLTGKIASELKHLDALRDRIQDTSSKVLVTGDLNAGKSTLVNALMRREVMPMDEQPCTTTFCEVHDARENAGVEEVHMDKEGKKYDQNDGSTFERLPLSSLETLVVEEDGDHKPPLKVFVSDTRSAQESLIHNGVVDISLIDAPGLNRDSLKTTAVFARQDEIDVVVFVVSAANHFTLSAKEFIWTASNEKAYLFIVVNRFDQIKDKERCKRLVLEQIRQLSPRTYEEAEELVHFVDSAAIMESADLGAPPLVDANAESFDHLESALRSFVLDKRAKSKLLPAQTFVSKLLSDLDILASSNTAVARDDIRQALEELERAKPILDAMRKGKDGLERGLEVVEDGTTEEAARSAKARLNKALEVVSGGEVAPGAKEVALPAYPGLLDLWDYAQEVKHALLASLDASVSLAEDDARLLTSKGVERVASLADKHLPRDVERPQKVFKPEAMFARRPATNRRKSMNVGHVGLGLVNRSELADVSMSDIFDASQQLERLVKYFTLGGGSSSSSDSKKSSFLSIEDGNSTVTTVGFTTALGALGLVTGKTLSTRTIVESIYHLSELLRSPTARKLAGPAIAALTLGLSFYVISDLPNAIPRRIGRSLATRLASEDGRVEGSTGEGSFVEANGERIGRETKRVLRAAAWDLRGSFEGALEERRKEVGKAEEMKKKAERAVDWFEEIVRRTEAVRVEAGWVVDVASDKQHQQQQHEVVA